MIQEYWDSLTDDEKLQYLMDYEESKPRTILRFARNFKGCKPSGIDFISFFKRQMIWLNGPKKSKF